MQFRHFSTFVFKHFSQTRNWVRVFVRNFCASVAGRYVSRGLLGRHALSPSLRFVTKILYEIMLLGFLCPTKPSKRAVHGAFSPCPGVHAGAFLRFMGIILQYLSRCASRSFRSTSAGRANPHVSVAFSYSFAIFMRFFHLKVC